IDKFIDELVSKLISSGPEAIKSCKELLRKVSEMSINEAKKYTAEVIAQLRISEEGQEGMNAFLEKRRPKWSK
ncbi:enoyl-CoA hydratase/isomerase family protein, partial [candidate division WOR-3 bacterium]|nr:enoyl-CoA hydratase/isomerase family protein [candidate division WOR-3 bacterium]